MTSVAATPASCTEDGNSAYYICGKCDKWFHDEEGYNETSQEGVVIPKSHDMTTVNYKNSTCTEDGNEFYYVCGSCGKWFRDGNGTNEITDKSSVVIPAEHRLSREYANSATCTADGNIDYYTCSRCDKWFADKDGENEITDKSTVVITAKGHDMSCYEATPATCTQPGNVKYYLCKTCSRMFYDEDGNEVIY